MDLRPSAGQAALVIASSQGLEKATAAALVHEGVNVLIYAREKEVLRQTEGKLQGWKERPERPVPHPPAAFCEHCPRPDIRLGSVEFSASPDESIRSRSSHPLKRKPDV